MTAVASTPERATGKERWREASGPAFLRSLERLRLNVRSGTGAHPGNNPVPTATQDSGLEFAKHRPYLPGDDLRHIDWNALARHDTKLVKTFRAEREAPLHILVDTSASMVTPAEDAKAEAAIAVAAGLAYISLRNRDPVRVAALDQSGARHVAPLLRHPQRLPLLTDGLRACAGAGRTTLDVSVRSYLASTRLPGIAIMISDFLVDKDDYQRAMGRLQAGGYAVAVIRILGQREREPTATTRRVRIFDVETGSERIVDLSPHHRALYARALQEHIEGLRSWCDAVGIPFCVIDTEVLPGIAMIQSLTRAGIVR